MGLRPHGPPPPTGARPKDHPILNGFRSPKTGTDLAIGKIIATAANVSSRRIRLAAYVTRLERVRGSRPSWVQIPHPPPEEIPAPATQHGVGIFVVYGRAAALAGAAPLLPNRCAAARSHPPSAMRRAAAYSSPTQCAPRGKPGRLRPWNSPHRASIAGSHSGLGP